MVGAIKKLFRGIGAVFSNEMRSIYKSNLMVQDLKSQYLKGCDSIVSLNNQRVEIAAQKKISLEELDKIRRELETVTRDLKAVNPEDKSVWNHFNVLKTKYESLKSRETSVLAALEQYDTVLENLNKIIAKTKSECEKLKVKYTETEFNVQQFKNMRRINDVISVTTDSLAESNIDVESLNDDLKLEIAKFNVRAEDTDNEIKVDFVTNPADMKNFIDSL